MKKITLFTLVAIFSMALVGCETTKETNSNKAIVVNSNAAANMSNSNMMNSNMMSSNTMSNSNSMSMNSNMTRADYDRDKDRYEKDAKASGRTVGSGVNDSWLWTKTRAALATTAGLRDSTIDVDVTNDVITLKGTVATAAQKTQAETVAKGIDGQKGIKNELKVQPADSMTNQMTSGNSNMSNANMKK